jgi:hypothetical protein
MIEDQLWLDAQAMDEKRNHARAVLDDLAEWAGWDKSRGDTAMVYLSIQAEIRKSTEDELVELVENMEERIDHLCVAKLAKNL